MQPGSSRRRADRGPAILLALLAAACSASGRGLPSPQSAVDELLDADRAFAARAGQHDMATAVSAMFRDDVAMSLPERRMSATRDEAVAALRAAPLNAGSTVTWVPIRGGISADGQQGFTYGYLSVLQNGVIVPHKYLSYWVRGPDGWRVVAWRRGRRPAGTVSTDLRPPALPPAMVAVSTDAGRLAEFGRSLAQAEQAFSDEAQRIGLGPAFQRHGSEDAMNMGGPDDTTFVFSARRIGAGMGGSAAEPSPVSWSADRTIVASSGDLGITIGIIRQNGGSERYPFFTVWRRSSSSGRWLYVAE